MNAPESDFPSHLFKVPDLKEFEILYDASHESCKLKVDFNYQDYARRNLEEELESQIDVIWEKRQLANSSLYNATKFRYFDACKEVNPNETLYNNQTDLDIVQLKLGLTDYKTFLGTNCAENWHRILARSPNHLASPIGNAAIVETDDSKILLLKRSELVGECPNTIVCPGGHPEPGTLGFKSLNNPQYVQSDEICVRIEAELESSILREVMEETGIERSFLKLKKFLGVVRRKLNFRPVLAYLVECSCTSEEIIGFYNAGKAVDESESRTLFCWNPEALFHDVLDNSIVEMPGCHRGLVQLYRNYRMKEENL